MRVAIMQPYFAPYAGYFRLLHATDIFVIFDTAQFLRRGWMHRNRVPNRENQPVWLTLPLAKAPQKAPIHQMRFAADAAERWRESLRGWSACDLLTQDPALDRAVQGLTADFTDYTERLLLICADRLGLDRPTVMRASSLGDDEAEARSAQERIVHMVTSLGASTYVNAPGGRDLYEPAMFEAQGLRLRFLPPYEAPVSWSILHRLLTEDTGTLKREIVSQCTLLD